MPVCTYSYGFSVAVALNQNHVLLKKEGRWWINKLNPTKKMPNCASIDNVICCKGRTGFEKHCSIFSQSTNFPAYQKSRINSTREISKVTPLALFVSKILWVVATSMATKGMVEKTTSMNKTNTTSLITKINKSRTCLGYFLVDPINLTKIQLFIWCSLCGWITFFCIAFYI